jgi:hypothetical protein
MRRIVIFGAALACLAATATDRVAFEAKPRVVSRGSFPQIAVRSSGALSLLKVEKGDLWFITSNDAGDSFESRVRVNATPGEVVAHGENYPQLIGRSRSELYALWQARRGEEGSVLRFARSANWGESFSKPIDVDGPVASAGQGFYTMQVSPKGVIYVAWLDGRDRGQGRAGTSAVYIARSIDRGATFEKSVRISLDACPCCRPSIAAADENHIYVGWRTVLDGEVRDTAVAASSDGGATWSKSVRVADDGWRITGCPHSGPSLAVLAGRVYVAWHTVRGNRNEVFLAWSDDGGAKFSSALPLAEGLLDANHPVVQAADGALGIALQGRSAAEEHGWGKVKAYYREFRDGRLTPLIDVGHAAGSASYPALMYESPDHVFLAWTEADEDGQQIVLARGRRTTAPALRSDADAH